jgi:hypothetical protein
LKDDIYGAFVGWMRNEQKIVESKSPFGRFRSRWEDNFKTGPKEIWCKDVE